MPQQSRAGTEAVTCAGEVGAAWPDKLPDLRRGQCSRSIVKAMNEAPKPSLTPPEWCFRQAQKKVQRGDYDKD